MTSKVVRQLRDIWEQKKTARERERLAQVAGPDSCETRHDARAEDVRHVQVGAEFRVAHEPVASFQGDMI